LKKTFVGRIRVKRFGRVGRIRVYKFGREIEAEDLHEFEKH